MPQYTKSKDGLLRANIHLGRTFRWTKEQFDEYTRMARALGHKSIYDYAEALLTDNLYLRIFERFKDETGEEVE